MKIDAVYKLGEKCEWDDFDELRYSIRSVEKNIPFLNNIIIVGHRPRWLTNIIHIHAKDCYLTNKDSNLINKLILASIRSDTTEYFLNISDDQYIVKPITFEELQLPIIDNSHINFIPGQQMNRWQQRLKRTIDVLKKEGYKHNCYEAHTPYLLNKNDYIHTLFKYDYGCDIGYCGNTLYFNTLNKQGRMITQFDLCRVTSKMTYESLKEKVRNVKYINHSVKGINEDLKKIYKELFPIKSKFELF